MKFSREKEEGIGSKIYKNPMNIECKENDSQIIVSVDKLNQYEDLFANWKGTYE